MKKINDEEIKNWLEENDYKSGGVPASEVKVYSHLFDLLGSEPAEGLPYDFSANVIHQVQAQTRERSHLRWYLISIAIVTIVIAFIYGLFLLLKPQLGSAFLNIATEYKWVFILGIFSLLTIQYVDQILIKSTIFKRHWH